MTLWQKLTDFVSSASWPGTFTADSGEAGAANKKAGLHPQADVRFTMALIALLAKMARSDGAVTWDEVEAFKRIVVVPPEEEANVRRLFDLAKQSVAGFEAYARQIGALFQGDGGLGRDVVEALYVIASADGVLHEREEAHIDLAARLIGVPASDLAHIRSLFVAEASSPYAVLGLTPDASADEIRARHRALVWETHPDRLTARGIPAEFVAVAERKLAAINAAYDTIAQERGL
jgi:DnaJ like chaperone protein